MKFNLHHIGYLVKDLARYRENSLEGILEIKDFSPVYEDLIQKVKVQFAKLNDETYIELVEPLGDDSPLLNTLKTKGEGMYHLCYEVSDIEQTVKELQEKRCLLLQAPVPATAFEGRRISFLYTRDKDLIELVEKK